MSHSGLNWYDNTARMHDPLLMHFATPDPIYTKYTDFSPPWSVNSDKFRLSVYSGPQFFVNFSVKGNYEETRNGNVSQQSIKFTNSGLDIGWGLGIGADINKRWHVHIEGMYGLSNLCIDKMSGADLKRAAISVGVGYNLNAPTKYGHRRPAKK